MTAAPPMATGDTAIADTTGENSAEKTSTRRLFAMIVPLTIAIYLIIGAVPDILLPLHVQRIDAAGKAANLALITGIGAFAAMIASPVAGLLSDRTRSRFGRRTPWIVGGYSALFPVGLALAIAGALAVIPIRSVR